MHLIDHDDEITVSVSRDELRLLASSVGEALMAVEEWEFSTRLGAETSEARQLRSEIRDILSRTQLPQ